MDDNVEERESVGFKVWENLAQNVTLDPLIEIPISDLSGRLIFLWPDHNKRPATQADRFHQWFGPHI
jgi:hypothetical protein